MDSEPRLSVPSAEVIAVERGMGDKAWFFERGVAGRIGSRPIACLVPRSSLSSLSSLARIFGSSVAACLHCTIPALALASAMDDASSVVILRSWPSVFLGLAVACSERVGRLFM